MPFRIFGTNHRVRTHREAAAAAQKAGHNGYVCETTNRHGQPVSKWIPIEEGLKKAKQSPVIKS